MCHILNISSELCLRLEEALIRRAIDNCRYKIGQVCQRFFSFLRVFSIKIKVNRTFIRSLHTTFIIYSDITFILLHSEMLSNTSRPGITFDIVLFGSSFFAGWAAFQYKAVSARWCRQAGDATIDEGSMGVDGWAGGAMGAGSVGAGHVGAGSQRADGGSTGGLPHGGRGGGVGWLFLRIVTKVICHLSSVALVRYVYIYVYILVRSSIC